MSVESFSLLYRLPYDYRSPIPYLFTMFLELGESYLMSIGLLCGYLTLNGICIFVIAFVDDLKQCLSDAAAKIYAISAKEGAVGSAKANVAMKVTFCEVIELHADVLK